MDDLGNFQYMYQCKFYDIFTNISVIIDQDSINGLVFEPSNIATFDYIEKYKGKNYSR